MNTRTHSTLISILAFVVLAGCTQAPESDNATISVPELVERPLNAKTYQIDVNTATIGWIGTKVTGRHNGIIKLQSGDILIEDGNVVGGKIVFDMHSIQATDDMGGEKLTGHLKSADFFDVEQYPTAVFEITGSEARIFGEQPVLDDGYQENDRFKVGNPTHRVSGNLTMHGQTNNISFPARVEFAKGGLLIFAKFNINRTDWGVNFTGREDDLIREEVNIGFELKAR